MSDRTRLTCGASDRFKYDPGNLEQVHRAIEMILDPGDRQLLHFNPNFVTFVEGTIRIAPYCSDEFNEAVFSILAPQWAESKEDFAAAIHQHTNAYGSHNESHDDQAVPTGWIVSSHGKDLPAFWQPSLPPAANAWGWGDNDTAPATDNATSITDAEDTWGQTIAQENTSSPQSNTQDTTQNMTQGTAQDEVQDSAQISIQQSVTDEVDDSDWLVVDTSEDQASSPPPLSDSSSITNADLEAATTPAMMAPVEPNEDLQAAFENLALAAHYLKPERVTSKPPTVDESALPYSAWALHSLAHLRVLAAAQYVSTFQKREMPLRQDPMIMSAARSEALEILYQGGTDNVFAAHAFMNTLEKQEAWEKKTGYSA